MVQRNLIAKLIECLLNFSIYPSNIPVNKKIEHLLIFLNGSVAGIVTKAFFCSNILKPNGKKGLYCDQLRQVDSTADSRISMSPIGGRSTP